MPTHKQTNTHSHTFTHFHTHTQLKGGRCLCVCNIQCTLHTHPHLPPCRKWIFLSFFHPFLEDTLHTPFRSKNFMGLPFSFLRHNTSYTLWSGYHLFTSILGSLPFFFHSFFNFISLIFFSLPFFSLHFSFHFLFTSFSHPF